MGWLAEAMPLPVPCNPRITEVRAFPTPSSVWRLAGAGLAPAGRLALHWARRNANQLILVGRLISLGLPLVAGSHLCQTETCLVLSLVNGSRFQPLQRSRSVIPASRAIRSSSDGQT